MIMMVRLQYSSDFEQTQNFFRSAAGRQQSENDAPSPQTSSVPNQFPIPEVFDHDYVGGHDLLGRLSVPVGKLIDRPRDRETGGASWELDSTGVDSSPLNPGPSYVRPSCDRSNFCKNFTSLNPIQHFSACFGFYKILQASLQKSRFFLN